jgi:hypothetical protein
MSWDALIVKVAGDNYEKPTEHAKLVAMGNVRELRAAINEAFPGTKWDRSGDGFVQIESLGLEFRLIGKTASGKSSNTAQEDDKVQSIGVSARGTGNPNAVPLSGQVRDVSGIFAWSWSVKSLLTI